MANMRSGYACGIPLGNHLGWLIDEYPLGDKRP